MDFSDMDFPFNKKTNCVSDTEAVGKMLGEAIREEKSLPRFVAMYGDLGVGKTAFTRGFVSAFTERANVKSPTFALVNEYGKGDNAVFHFDMYRIDSEDDLWSIGFYDYLDRQGIAIAEWCEKIPYALPESYVKVTISKISEESPDERMIKIELV